jgi:hypothetical protein
MAVDTHTNTQPDQHRERLTLGSPIVRIEEVKAG